MVAAGFLRFSLAERAAFSRAIGIGRTADDRLAGGTERLSFGALSEGVVKHDDIGPLGVAFPVFGFRNKAIGDVALALRFNVIADVVAFLENFPGDIADESRDGNKQEFAFIH